MMSSYLTQLVSQISNLGVNQDSNKYLQTHQDDTPKLKYITVFNPKYVSAKAETNQELIKQIMCFISLDELNDDSELNKVEQVKIIGLIQAIEGLSSSFGYQGSDSHDNVNSIKASKSIILVKRLEGDFKIACSVSIPLNGVKEAAINDQMIKLLHQSHQFFVILNTSLQNIIDNYGIEILQNLLKEHWMGFLKNYNSENFKFPPSVQWPNSLNYKGFLGFFDNHMHQNLYKQSSLDLSYNVKVEMDQLYKHPVSGTVPNGIIISHFDKSLPKTYGLVYCNNLYDDDIQDYPIDKSSLIDIYNLLEYYDYHEKLNTSDLTKLSNHDLFSSPQSMKQNISFDVPESDEEEEQSGLLRSSAVAAMDLLNPVNLTNNLMILPLSFTMNSMMNITQSTYNTIDNSRNWLKIPSYFKFGSSEENEVDDDEYDDDEGSYLVGLVNNEGNERIQRKLVYLNTQLGDNKQEEREYLLVIYQKNHTYITLIYESSLTELDDPNFYTNLSHEVMIPLTTSLQNVISGGAELEASVGSLTQSSNGMIVNGTIDQQLDSDFFFVIYDKTEGWIKSSLPYLPLPLENMSNLDQISKLQLNIRSAMFYLHDQLSDLFFFQNNNQQFFKNESMNEYFHKFNTNKINDWMFYYIKYQDKFIIIIKNQNHKQKASKTKAKMASISKQKAATQAAQATQPNTEPIVSHDSISINTATTMHSPLVNTSDKVNYQVNNDFEFIHNLGEDVKLWFENFQINGNT